MNVVLFILAERVGAYPTFTLMIALYCGTMDISKKEGADMDLEANVYGEDVGKEWKHEGI